MTKENKNLVQVNGIVIYSHLLAFSRNKRRVEVAEMRSISTLISTGLYETTHKRKSRKSSQVLTAVKLTL
jgi:hypothetical protein